MNLFARFLLGYALIAAIAISLGYRFYAGEIVPGIRDSVEDSLVQSANLLAEFAAASAVRDGRLDGAALAKVLDAFRQRRFSARIGRVERDAPDVRVYATDERGVVVFDSAGRATGEDYSRWNDVHLTLRGRYGARTTREDPRAGDAASTMYVAAPIRVGERVVGVLSVGQPAAALQPFAEHVQRRIRWWLAAAFLAAVPVAVVLAHRFSRDIVRIGRFADAAARGEPAPLPRPRAPELRRLAGAVDRMRRELAGKAEVERMAQLLAHELRSPVSAIQAAAELLEDSVVDPRDAALARTVATEARRVSRIADGVLRLAVVEALDRPERADPIALAELVEEIVASRAHAIAERALVVERRCTPLRVEADRFLLRHAIANLLDNAIDFSAPGGRIEIDARRGAGPQAPLEITVRDHGAGVPDYALPHVFEPLYSVPRPDTGRRGIGLGLNFVQRAAQLYGGTVELANAPGGGATARLSLRL